MTLASLAPVPAAIILAPLLPGVINKTKAFFAGRTGQPLLQPYYDIIKLLQKGSVFSTTTSWIFQIAPVVCLAGVLVALLLTPFGGQAAVLPFTGDLILFAYLFGLLRFFIVVGALDTGSSFEGMGASREVQFSALAEPALLLGLAVLGRETSSLSISHIYSAMSFSLIFSTGPSILLIAVALFVVFLAENARIPVDDPNTHLELTMIHEVMVLDNSGPDLGIILYTSAIKMWILGSLIVGILLPVHTGNLMIDLCIGLGGLFAVAVITGIVESTMARLRLVRVPQLLVAAGVLSVLAFVLVLR